MSVHPHGITILEQQTAIVPPVHCSSAIPIAIGIAPINTGETGTAMIPKIAFRYEEAVSQMGFTSQPEAYPLFQLTKAAFELYNVSPVVYINVLDPQKHRSEETETTAAFLENKILLKTEGIILDSIALSSAEDATKYTEEDFAAGFDNEGFVLIEKTGVSSILEGEVTLRYRKIDPSKVTTEDVLAGIRKVKEVYPRFGVAPGILLAPGFSQIPEVYLALAGQTENLGGLFKCSVLADIDISECEDYQKAYAWKNKNNYNNKHSLVLYPKCRVGGDVFWMSAILAPLIAHTDAQYESVPAVSPSNKPFQITGLCGENGKEIIMDMEQANLLNGQGIATAINMNGWKFWGDRTAAYPGITDVKDVMLPVRRMFNWQSNTFILTYFQKVDNPANYRLIESIVDSENIRLGGLKAKGYIADAKMIFRLSENPETSLIDGKITLHQMFTPYPAAEHIVNTLEYDVNALRESLSGVSSGNS